jgi:RimJ/RimL family protein N-acetyltransferase
LQAIWSIPQFGIAYFIRKSARNQGYATEAGHALTLLAFRELQAKKVEIYCDAENLASQKIPQQLGFTLECSKKGGWPRPDNQLADLLTYALFLEVLLPKTPIKW